MILEAVGEHKKEAGIEHGQINQLTLAVALARK